MASNVDTFPTDGNAYTMNHPWNTVWAFINNASAVNVVVATDQGFKLTVPPGAGLPWSLPVPTRNLTVQSASASANGLVYITASDSLTGAQSYASNVVTGTVNANILNSNLNVTASGTVNANILNSVLTANINNANLSVVDSLVETNTTVLTGLLAKNIAAFTLAANATFTQAISAAITAIGVAIIIQDGFLSLSYVASGQEIFLLRKRPFYNSAGLSNYTEKVYSVPIPAASSFKVKVEQNLLGISGVLKW